MENCEILKKLGITAHDLDLIAVWSTLADVESEVGFDWNGQWIVDIFMDTTRRFDKTLAQAVDYYGFENVRKFCFDALARIRNISESVLDNEVAFTEFARWTSDDDELILYQVASDDFSVYYENRDYSTRGSLLDVMKEVNEDIGIENLKEKKND